MRGIKIRVRRTDRRDDDKGDTTMATTVQTDIKTYGQAKAVLVSSVATTTDTVSIFGSNQPAGLMVKNVRERIDGTTDSNYASVLLGAVIAALNQAGFTVTGHGLLTDIEINSYVPVDGIPTSILDITK